MHHQITFKYIFFPSQRLIVLEKFYMCAYFLLFFVNVLKTRVRKVDTILDCTIPYYDQSINGDRLPVCLTTDEVVRSASRFIPVRLALSNDPAEFQCFALRNGVTANGSRQEGEYRNVNCLLSL